MIVWHSIYLKVAYGFLGWMSFLCWSLCFYPQVLLNYRRESVVGLNFDFPVLNPTEHTSYLIYNAAMYFSPEVQSQYHDKYGPDQMIPVGLNDVLFSMHAVSLTGDQRISKTCTATTAIIWVNIQVIITTIKYIPQAYTNFKRKSTVGWSIGFVPFDLARGLFGLGQMFDLAGGFVQGSTVNFYGNTGKLLLSLEVIFFDLLFMYQHYVLYPEKKKTRF